MPKCKPRECDICSTTYTDVSKYFRRGHLTCKSCEDSPDFKKICQHCLEEKLGSQFRENRSKCLDCERVHGRNYRRTNNKAEEWVKANKEKMAKLQKDYYEKNKLDIRAKERERTNTDDYFKYNKYYRRSVSNFITKGVRFHKLLNISKQNFVDWLEYCFEKTDENLTLENYGDNWHLDHVIPIHSLKNHHIVKDNTDAHPLIYMWFNTIPVDSKKNLQKNKYIDKNAIINQFRLVEQFIKIHELDKIHFVKYKHLAQKIIDDKTPMTWKDARHLDAGKP